VRNKTKENKTKERRLLFARGTFSYFALAILIAVVLLFGLFDSSVPRTDYRILGSYGDYNVLAKKQGMNVYEVKLLLKDAKRDDQPIPIDDIKNVMWIVAQTFVIQSSHPIEENGKAYGLIVTVENR